MERRREMDAAGRASARIPLIRTACPLLIVACCILSAFASNPQADCSVDRLMATLIDDPQYHFWVRGRDVGPKGYDAVRNYYEYYATSGGAVFESPKDRVVVDDHHVVSEADVRNYVPGRVAKARGYSVPDDSGHYLVRFRNVVFFEFAEDPTHALCEDSYTQIDPDAWERVADEDLPQVYVAYLASLV